MYLFGSVHESINDIRIKMPATLIIYTFHNFVKWPGLFINTSAHKRVIYVNNRHQSAGEGNIVSLKCKGLSCPVIFFVVCANDLYCHLDEIGKFFLFEKLLFFQGFSAVLDVLLHDLEFFGSQFSRL